MDEYNIGGLKMEKYQEYFMGPITLVRVEIIKQYENYTVLAKIDGIEKHVCLSPCGQAGELVWRPAK
jgi:hypothetical protein